MSKQICPSELTTYLQAEQDRIYRLAYSYMQNEQDALDVMQTAVVKALSASTRQTPRYLKTWVYRIVVNTAIDTLRARKRLVLSDDWTFADDASYLQEDDNLDVREALGRLPADLKAIVILRYFHDFKLQEVADALDMNLNTVKTRLYRALRLLRVEVEDDHE
ncbi:MAG: sigma-70 family RNA polymerase sigma factor [Anaerolineae bacterium]